MLYPDFNELISLRSYAARFLLSSDNFVTSSLAGDYDSPFYGQGLEFEGVREYCYGDDIRNIDWRVTARMGKSHTKIFKEERQRDVLLCADIGSNMYFGTRNTFKSLQVARIMAILGWIAVANRNKLKTCLFADNQKLKFFAKKTNKALLCATLRSLSNQDNHIYGKDDFANSLNIEGIDNMLIHINKLSQKGSLIYIISDFHSVTDNLYRGLSNLRRRSNIVLITVDDIADRELIQVGDLFCSSNINNQEKFYLNTSERLNIQNYREIWQKNRSKLQNFAQKLAINIMSFTTQDDIKKELLLKLKNIKRNKILNK